MTIITYDVKPDHPKYSKTFCQINDDDSVILMDKPFIHSIGFISYAMSHYSTNCDIYELMQFEIAYKDLTMYEYFAFAFNYERRMVSLTSNLHNPKSMYDIYLHRHDKYTPPEGKRFIKVGQCICMFIRPDFKAYVIVGKTRSFGKKHNYHLGEYMTVKELVNEYPEYKKDKKYLYWLEDEMNAGRIKIKNGQISINQQKLKEFL